MSKKSDDVKKFADLVHGRIVPKNETGADRKRKGIATSVPKFKTKEERQKFYMDYIPALYWVEIEEKNPDDLSQSDLDFFWYAFTLGVRCLEGLKEESDMDG